MEQTKINAEDLANALLKSFANAIREDMIQEDKAKGKGNIPMIALIMAAKANKQKRENIKKFNAKKRPMLRQMLGLKPTIADTKARLESYGMKLIPKK